MKTPLKNYTFTQEGVRYNPPASKKVEHKPRTGPNSDQRQARRTEKNREKRRAKHKLNHPADKK